MRFRKKCSHKISHQPVRRRRKQKKNTADNRQYSRRTFLHDASAVRDSGGTAPDRTA